VGAELELLGEGAVTTIQSAELNDSLEQLGSMARLQLFFL